MWTVTGTTDTMGKGDDGQVTAGVNATVRLDDGTTTTVFVPKAALLGGEAMIRPRIDETVSALTLLKGLKG